MRDSPAADSPRIVAFDLSKVSHKDESSETSIFDREQISAADYDDNLDRLQDEEKRVRTVVEKDSRAVSDDDVEEVEEIEEEEEDIDDMFSLNDTVKKKKVIRKVAVRDCLFVLFASNVVCRNLPCLLWWLVQSIQPPIQRAITLSYSANILTEDGIKYLRLLAKACLQMSSVLVYYRVLQMRWAERLPSR